MNVEEPRYQKKNEDRKENRAIMDIYIYIHLPVKQPSSSKRRLGGIYICIYMRSLTYQGSSVDQSEH